MSVANDSFANTFLRLGANSYLGYWDYVEVKNDQAIVRKLLLPLVQEKQLLHQAYEAVRTSGLFGVETLQFIKLFSRRGMIRYHNGELT
ncbi:hypothetical protein I6N90_21540 [Paenibacillus sp. GSMTC-2017]|uniref:hypothetical protein n=1 Tax=Paenibacillus sp. GSMTC-2017 TaxID=2794350 RepID=UPI0018D7259A|nr:hypothetical protein [Paenibacillus sp. GSMTC-2017]MBH5320380.1 hypothetical protein [Paenibacillus sp. GSMTC-2017]